MKTYDVAETGINVLGITLSVSDLSQILNVVLLAVSIASILFKIGLMIYNHLKKRDFDGVAKAIEEAEKDFKELRRKTHGRDHEGNCEDQGNQDR